MTMHISESQVLKKSIISLINWQINTSVSITASACSSLAKQLPICASYTERVLCIADHQLNDQLN